MQRDILPGQYKKCYKLQKRKFFSELQKEPTHYSTYSKRLIDLTGRNLAQLF